MEKKLTRDELLKNLIEQANDIFTTCEQKYDIRKILETSSNFKGKNHIFLVQCFFDKENPLFTVTEEQAIEQADLAFKEGNTFSCYYLALLLKDKNPVKARNYLRISCDCAFPQAYLEMAKCKHYGVLFLQDRKGAMEYYRKASLCGMKEGYEGMLKLYSEDGNYEAEKKVYDEALKKGIKLSGIVS